MRANGLDESDKVMRQTVAFKPVQALGIAAKRGCIGDAGRLGGVRVWAELAMDNPALAWFKTTNDS
jgi:hypothetical protein